MSLDEVVVVDFVEQHPVQPRHEALEGLVFGEQPDHNGVELQGPDQPAVVES